MNILHHKLVHEADFVTTSLIGSINDRISLLTNRQEAFMGLNLFPMDAHAGGRFNFSQILEFLICCVHIQNQHRQLIKMSKEVYVWCSGSSDSL